MRNNFANSVRSAQPPSLKPPLPLYPLAVTDAQRTGFWMQALYLCVLVYFVGLIARRRTIMS